METAKLGKLLKYGSKVLRFSLGGFSHGYISRYIAKGHVYTGTLQYGSVVGVH